MRHFTFKILFCFISILAIYACKSSAQNKTESEIKKKIRFTEVGGKKIGGDLGIEISKDSTFFKEGNRILIREKTSPNLWNRLSSSITEREFCEIKSSESRNYVDDIDAFYEIETVNKKYSFLNLIISKNQKKALNFKSIIDSEFGRLMQMFMDRTSH